MGNTKFKPGEKEHPSGQFQEPGKKTEITSTQGKPLPPTSKPNKNWALVDPTKHKPPKKLT